MLAKADLFNVTQGHVAYCNLWKTAKAHLVAKRRVVAQLVDFEDALTDKQRRYYHGYVLTVIAQQVKVDGERRYPLPVWKEYFRKMFLGFKTVTEINPMTGKKRRHRVRVSTEGLGVRKYNELIERVTAHAATEFGVLFPVKLDEWIDPETGEIHGAN